MATVSGYLRRAAVGLVLVVATIGALGYSTLRSSLPALDGKFALLGLSAPVVIERDALGVPTLTGSNRVDLARALVPVAADDPLGRADARAVDENAGGPVRSFRPGDRSFCGGRVADVAGDRNAADGLRDGFGGCAVEVEYSDFRALGRQRLRSRPSEPGTAARDNRRRAFDPHSILP